MAIASIDIATLIIQSPDVVGGRPRIAGTRVSIQRIAAWYKTGLGSAPEVRIAETLYQQ